MSVAITNVHFVHCVTTVAVTDSQLPAAAADNVFQLNVFAPLQIFVQYVKLFAVTAILVYVNVAATQLLTHPSSSVVLYE